MARLPRLALAEHAHWLMQRGHDGRAVFADEADRQSFLAALREASVTERVRLHAVALLDTEVHLLATPAEAQALSRMMQAVGRRYVSAYHRRHGGRGTLWEGRFRCAIVEPGPSLLDVLVLIDTLAGGEGPRSGSSGLGLLVDPPEYWTLGNTPFERQALWRRRLAEGLPPGRASALRLLAGGNWVVGSTAFAAQIAEQSARPAEPRPRGRPRRATPD